jgi:hypothetical protein
MELYGKPMLVDGVGTSLIANAPYAQNNTSVIKSAKDHLKNKVDSAK